MHKLTRATRHRYSAKRDVSRSVVSVLIYLTILTLSSIALVNPARKTDYVEIGAMSFSIIIVFALNLLLFLSRKIETVKKARMNFLSICCFLFILLITRSISSYLVTEFEVFINHFGFTMQNTLQSVSASSESALSVFLKLVIVGPLIEELLFRYLVMKRLQRYGTGFAILSTSILFMFYHMNFPQFPYTLLFGLILGILTCYYSFFWSVTMHSLNNAFSFMQLVLSRFSITIIGFLGYIVFVAALIVIIEGRKEVLGVVKDRFIREFGNLRLINVLFKNVWFIIFVSLSLFGAAKMLSRL